MQLVEVGQPLNPRQVAATLDRLYSTGLYDDLQVDARESENGVIVTFITRARRFIGHVGAQGQISEPPSRAIIISGAQMNLGTPFDEADLVTARKSIEQELRNNGLFESKVNVATITDPDTNRVTIRFLVDSGQPAKYTTPVISGETKLSDSTIIRATGWRLALIHRWRRVTQSLTDKGINGIQQKYAKKSRLTASVDLQSWTMTPIRGAPRRTSTSMPAKDHHQGA